MTLLLVVLLAVAAVALWPRESERPRDACGLIDAKPWEAGINATSQATICLLNRERTTRGLPALQQNAVLDQVSLEHSQDMVRANYFEHTALDGRTVGDRLRAIGYRRGANASAGENIAYGVGSKATPAAIVRSWMNSPPHRADILRPAFTEIGIGIAIGAPEQDEREQQTSATYTTDFGGVVDPSLPTG
jgi:uncharacterized protein YkwD